MSKIKNKDPHQTQEWFHERIGKSIRRISGGMECDPKREVVIHNKDHADYLYDLQKERMYRYADFATKAMILQ